MSGEPGEASLIVEGPRLRAVFSLRGDRYSHEVLARDAAGAWQPVLRSIEGSAADIWPASPPLQQVHREEQAGRALILAVGMAGRSHWSASVAVDNATGALDFDLACRVWETPAGLGSTYEALLADGAAPRLTSIDGAWQRDAHVWRLAAPAGGATFPHTVRWRYRVEPV